MDKLSGLVLEVYDDRDGAVFRSIFPDKGALPNLIKEAHEITPREREELPDDVFALVLIDGDTTLRKYACIDAGNTALAVEYFLKTAHKLPEEAQKVGAQNLVTTCGWYGIEPPAELQKIALVGDLAGGAVEGLVGDLPKRGLLGKATSLGGKAMGAFSGITGAMDTAGAIRAKSPLRQASGAVVNPNLL